MANNATPNQGYLNTNSFKKHDKQPDFRATVEVDSAFIKGLAEAAANGGASIFIAGWKGVSKRDGEAYVFLKLASEKYQTATPGVRTGDFQRASEDTPY